MSYELQKIFVIESYKATDLHEFVKMCRYTNQILKDVENKSRNIRKDFNNNDNIDDATRNKKIIVIVNSNQNNQNNQNANKSISRSRFEISGSSFCMITQSSDNQMNNFNCYHCEKSEHFSRNYRQLKDESQ